MRHVCLLKVRSTALYVPTCFLAEQLLGRPTLEALGLNRKQVLEATVGKLGSTIDMDMHTPSSFKKGTISGIIHDGLNHSEEIHLDKMENKGWLELAIDTPQEMDKAITNAIESAT